ncbi:hypothetical protein FOZ61_004776 [Perkinsus olseni]|uniref:Uncharacterized protein n=1 Tax=Perkinsus olseni TaxID=32597 RepID=A0A7J6MDX7_PEROL|nr:hypothetical protein FOZ61_004776 [Perkinsus olseni]
MKYWLARMLGFAISMSQEQQQDKRTAVSATSDGLAETGVNEGIRSSDALRRIFSERDQRLVLHRAGFREGL